MAEQATWSGREALPARRGRREALSRPGMASPSGLAMLAGLIWCLAVALVDVMLGTRSVVIGLEVAGPMMAAAFAGARRTAIVGVTAVGLSVVLGLSDHIFGTLDHIDRMGAVALGSVIAAWVATLRERREEAVAAAREAAARERQRRLALQASDSLHRLEAALGLAEGAEDVTEAAFRAVRDEMQASSCALTLLDELGTPIFIHARGFPRGVAPAGTASAHHELPAVAGIESVPPLLVRDVDKHTGDEAGRGLGRLVSALASVGQKAACVLPLASGAETVGAFVACWERPREFSDEEATWLQSVGAQFVVAVHRTRLVALERAEARRAAELAQLAASLSKAASAEDVATHALAALRAALGPRACSIELSPPEPARLRSAATNENTKGLLKDRGAETRADQGFGIEELFGEGVSAGVPVFVEDAGQARARFRSASGLYPAFAMLALVASSEVLGALVVCYGDPHRFEAPERSFLVTLAGHTAQALERARLYDEEREARQRLALLGEATRLLSASLEPETVCERLIELVPTGLADLTAILVPTRAGLRRTLSRALSPEGARLSRLLPHHQLSAYGGDDPVLRAYESATAQHAATPPEVLEAAGLKGALDLPERGSLLAGLCGLAVPMVSAGSVLGVMTFARAGAEPRPFDADDVSLACELAARAGLALDNANRYQEEHRVAEVLQRAVLPDSLPRLGGFTLDAEYRPGAAGSFAGGDWYDALVLGDGRLLLSVGDVMGKGPTAAALMGQVRSAIRSYGVEDHRPSRILERLDRLFQLVGEERLVSVVVAVLDPAIGSVELSNAGHPPALMVSSDGGARVLDQARSIIVGAGGPPPRRTDAHFVIGPGETLVVYSDGLIERRGEPLTRGLSRLLDTLRKESARWPTWHPGSACAIADSLLGSLPRTDDVVVMTLHRVAEETVPRAGPDSVLSSELLLSAALDSPSGARRFVTGRLLHRHPLVAERAAVLVSELVTNVVRHAEGELRVVVSELPSGVVRVEVADHSPELPEKKELDPLSDDGRGLRLMEALADRWGHRRDPNGRFAKIVWFEVGRERQDYPASTAAPGYLPGPGAQLRAPVEAGGIGAAPSAR